MTVRPETARRELDHEAIAGQSVKSDVECGLVPDVASSGLRIGITRPAGRDVVVVHAVGEIDSSTVDRLREILAHRLRSTAKVIVLDLADLRFFGVCGLELLVHMRHRATTRGKELRLVGRPPCLLRALRAAGWERVWPARASVREAVDLG